MACEEVGRQPDFGKRENYCLIGTGLRSLTRHQEFVAAPALAPPEVQVDQAAMEQYQKEMADAANMPLPDEEDPDL